VVLHPVTAGSTLPSSDLQPAWRVIERTQKQVAGSYWLVTQPDHAVLAGALAAGIVSPEFPIIESSTSRAIAVHDAGWAIFDAESNVTARPALDAIGKPLSFLEIEPPEFLRAWTASIEGAAGLCPAGGYIVSRHFCALGEGRLAAAIDVPENSAQLRSFLNHEAERREGLMAEAGRSQEELDSLLLVLQFCDLVSLYLCCGAGQPVEFPQEFSSGKVRVQREKDVWVLEPSPFRRGSSHQEVSLQVKASGYPSAETTTTQFTFRLR
jgi:hypothetical protein